MWQVKARVDGVADSVAPALPTTRVIGTVIGELVIPLVVDATIRLSVYVPTVRPVQSAVPVILDGPVSLVGEMENHA